MTRLSIVVPTYNRAEYLLKAVTSFLEQSLAGELYEVIVVDNNSSDHTKEIVDNLANKTAGRCRYVSEKKQGLHHARNKGILESKGDIVVFGDNDIIATNTWLESILAEFDQNHQTGVAGGRVKPLWPRVPDDWIFDFGNDKIHGVLAYLDYGEERLNLDNDYVFGCNMAIRRELAIQAGGSLPDAFPSELKHLSGTGEYGLIDNIRGLDYNIVYLPCALVYHQIDPTRLTIEYFIDRFERCAVEECFRIFRMVPDKKQAAIQLLDSAVNRLLSAETISQTKYNPEKFLLVEKSAVLMMMNQIIRVLSDASLYAHIVQKAYL